MDSPPLDRCAVIDGPPCPAPICPCRSPKPPPPLVCAGRPVDDTGQPIGEPCGRTYVAGDRPADRLPDGGWALGGRWRPPTAAEQAEEARAAGWSVTGPPMCPKCRKPSAELTQLARDLTRPALADRTEPMEGPTQ